MTPRNLSPGDVLGRYHLDREIGRGGMGVVYLAHDTQLDRPVALKVVNPEIGEDEQFRTRFTREMRIAAQLEHPNIVPVHEAGDIDGLLFIAMRYVEGEDLRSLLRRDGALGVDRAAQVAVQLGAALDVAHARGLVHRDVKPANVLIGGSLDEPHVYLSDFGLAREAASDSGLTNTGNWMGTVDYVAPEQLDGGRISARSDIYAMGCVLFETITGDVPFTGTIARKLYAHTHEPMPSVGASGGSNGRQVDAVLSRASAKEPDERYASAGDLGRALVGAIHGEGISEERSVATGVALSGIPTRPLPSPEPPTDTVMDALAGRPRVPSDAPAASQPEAARRNRTRLTLAATLMAALVLGAVVLATVLMGGSSNDNTKQSARDAATTTTTTPSGTGGAVVIRILAPSERSVVSGDFVRLRGTVTPKDATVQVQGQLAAVGNGVFVADATLHSGTNNIDVIASAPGSAPGTKAVVVRRQASKKPSQPANGAPAVSAVTNHCGTHETHSDRGSSFSVTEVTGLNTSCSDAAALIDAGPSGRRTLGWQCPVTGNRFYTSCARGAQRVSWSIPGGQSQVTGGQTHSSGCRPFRAVDARGVPFTATPAVLHNVDCSTVHTVINSGPQGRKNADWRCPLTGDPTYTSCTRGSEAVAWRIRY
jgi:serine/threonine protein kinase